MNIPYQDPHGWELISDIRAGRPGAFDEFYRRYARSVGAMAASQCSDPDAVDDIVQETFIRAWRHISTVRAERGSPMAWLSTITRNLIHDYRKNGWTRKVIIADHTADTHDPSGAVAGLVGREYRDSHPIEDVWVANLMRSSLEQLAPQYRESIEHYLSGGPHVEEAARLGISVASVKARRYRALRELRQHLSRRGVRSINDALEHSGEGWVAA